MMKHLAIIAVLLLTTFDTALAVATDTAPTAPCTTSGKPCQSSQSKNPSTPSAQTTTTAMTVSIQDDAQTVTAAIAAAEANAPREPRKSVLDNMYYRIMFWILAALAPLGAGMMIVLNLMEYRQRRADEIEE